MEDQENQVIKEETENTSGATKNMNSDNTGMSVASLVLGIVGLIVFAIPCGILAIIFAVLAKKKGKNAMATAGLVLGIIDAAVGILYLIVTMMEAGSLF